MKTLAVAIALLLVANVADGSEPITKIDGLTPPPEIFEVASRTEPLVIKSQEQAAEHFSEAEVEKLAKAVNFEEQFVLVFAWRGSGQDKLDYTVAESFPEQITFRYSPGRTRDLRHHFHVFALRNNVSWSVAR